MADRPNRWTQARNRAAVHCEDRWFSFARGWPLVLYLGDGDSCRLSVVSDYAGFGSYIYCYATMTIMSYVWRACSRLSCGRLWLCAVCMCVELWS